ncbi:inner membrane protein YpjD [Psychrobium sp. nBUS_13]|uniref:cytochrome C assembly family protein n=1 Tax=Psychrobium sp. nBUS_13 TaxID=3395319 RepID=UPI003C5EC316
MWIDISSFGAAVSYGVCLTLVLRSLFAHAPLNEKLVFGFAIIGIGFHSVSLGNVVLGSDGTNMSLLVVASIVSWLIAALLTIAIPKFAIVTLLPVVFGFALLAVLGVWLVPSSFITHFETRPGLLLHITIALNAYSTLVIAAFYAIQLHLIDSRLKSKKLNIASTPLPPLMTVEKQLYQLVMTGFVLLTLSLASGFFFLENMLAQGQAHKTVLSILAWACYAYLLWQHHQQGVKIKTSVHVTIIGAGLLTLAYFGSRFISEMLLA